MPFIARCPYCQVGRVRAPSHAVGLTANCPRCRTSFTLIDAGEADDAAPPRPAPSHKALPRAAVAVAESVSAPAVVDEPIAAPAYIAAPIEAEVDDEPAPTREPIHAAVLVSFILLGVAALATQVPYGRFATVALSSVGVLLAASVWFGSRRPLLPATATGLNALLFLAVLVVPTWLGIESWRPTPVDKEARTVRTFGADGLQPTAGDWVDASQAWQFEDVRVRVIASANVVELTGPKKKAKWSKRPVIHVRVGVGNVGVARAIEFSNWDGAKLTDAAGKPIDPAAFEPGWLPTVRRNPASLTPGQSAEHDLYFDAPADPGAFVRLELPGSAVGLADKTIRFQIPSGPLGYRR